MKYTEMDFKNAPSWKDILKARKRREKINNFLGIVFAIAFVFIGSIDYDRTLDNITVKAEKVESAPVEKVEEVKQPVIETTPEVVKVVDPQCDLSFQDVRVSRGLVINPPEWFKQMFKDNRITDCGKMRWMSQVAFYESEYCKGDINNCSNVVGSANDSGLFQYIPSTWASNWNTERGNSIFDAQAQFRATSLKYDLGGQGIWTTNKFVK